MLVGSLRPFGRPYACAGREGVLGEVGCDLMEYGLWVFGKEIAEGNPLVVGSYLDIQPVVAAIVLGEV